MEDLTQGGKINSVEDGKYKSQILEEEIIFLLLFLTAIE
jgi:hypothetical protein